MKLKDLNREQVQQLKIQYLDNLLQEEENRSISYGEMANIDAIIKDYDQDFIDTYSCYDFTDDDFFCSANEEESITDKCYDMMKAYIYNATEEELKEHYDWYKVAIGDKEDLLNTMFESYANNYDDKELLERCKDLLK